MNEDYKITSRLETAKSDVDKVLKYSFRLSAIAIITAGVVTVLSPVMVALAPVFEAIVRHFFGVGFE